jgi:formylglycine-generating enzyme required for sulfatase activity
MRCDLSASYPNPYACPGYRLPTAAEWEYAARAGTNTATYNGDLDDAWATCATRSAVLGPIAWYCGNSRTTQPVGTRDPNEWELYDMLGNVAEWCHDLWDGSDYPASAATDPWGLETGPFRENKGGSWFLGAAAARAAWRTRGFPDGRFDFVGFRPARTLP